MCYNTSSPDVWRSANGYSASRSHSSDKGFSPAVAQAATAANRRVCVHSNWLELVVNSRSASGNAAVDTCTFMCVLAHCAQMGFSNQTISSAAMMQPVCHWTVLSLVTWWVSFDGHAVAKQDCGPSQNRRIVFLLNTRPPLCRVHTTVSNIVVFVAGDPVKVERHHKVQCHAICTQSHVLCQEQTLRAGCSFLYTVSLNPFCQPAIFHNAPRRSLRLTEQLQTQWQCSTSLAQT